MEKSETRMEEGKKGNIMKRNETDSSNVLQWL